MPNPFNPDSIEKDDLFNYKEVEAQNQYDEAIDNILTGDIHLVSDVFLFSQIQRWIDQGKRSMLDEIDIEELNQRWHTNLFL